MAGLETEHEFSDIYHHFCFISQETALITSVNFIEINSGDKSGNNTIQVVLKYSIFNGSKFETERSF